ncbi:DUF4374 domain-containing protein [Sphingobacterium chungjuense]|uniref:DUF4374 domain-containing protein n=1 Tax=Sphingobacterium chungjuense TaxID=2675553 RepID=UPI0019D02DF3|nr:DUF4374 domain-containing protein [Sphingobacterium chungjuense]
MNKQFIRRRLNYAAAFLMVLSTLTISCSSDGPTVDPDENAERSYTVGAWAPDGSQYLAQTSSLTEGELSFVGNGLQANGSRYLWHKNHVYVMNLVLRQFIQYEMNADGTLTQKGAIAVDGVVPNYFQSLNVADDNTLLVLGSQEQGAKGAAGWARIRVPEFVVEARGTLNVPYNAATPAVEFAVGRGYVDGNKFVMGGYYYDYENKGYTASGVQAMVYDYPSMSNMRVITSNVTNAGIGYDYLSSLTSDEQGNHYFVASAGRFWTGLGGKSGVVRIKKGEERFDPDYFLDVTTPLGKQACLMGINYVGGGIAFGTVQYEEMMTSVRDRLGNVGQVVKLDLANKQVTLMNTPLSPVSMVRSPLVINGKYYTAITPTDGAAAIYEFDPAGDANAAKPGLKLLTGTTVNLIAPHPAR